MYSIIPPTGAVSLSNETHLDAIKSSYDVQEILDSKKKRQGFAGVDY